MIQEIRGTPRTYAEMLFAISLSPCAGCGSYETAGSALIPARHGLAIVEHSCPQCAERRETWFHTPARIDHLPSPGPHELGDEQPSRIIRPGQFIAELVRLEQVEAPSPEQLAPQEWRRQWGVNARVVTCINELLKFIPDGVARIPDAALDANERADEKVRPERYERAWLEGQRARVSERIEAYRREKDRIFALEAAASWTPEPRGELNARSAYLHKQWMDRGQTGEGRLDIANLDLSGRRYGFFDATAARLDNIDFSRSNLAFAKFDRAELCDLTMVQAVLANCSFSAALLTRCDLASVNLSLGTLDDVVVVGGRWDHSLLDRSLIRRAQFSGVSLRGVEFGNSALDGALFVDCDLHGASFALLTPDLLGTTAQARFERCDLRKTRWEGRKLVGVSFVDCRMPDDHG